MACCRLHYTLHFQLFTKYFACISILPVTNSFYCLIGINLFCVLVVFLIFLFVLLYRPRRPTNSTEIFLFLIVSYYLADNMVRCSRSTPNVRTSAEVVPCVIMIRHRDYSYKQSIFLVSSSPIIYFPV